MRRRPTTIHGPRSRVVRDGQTVAVFHERSLEIADEMPEGLAMALVGRRLGEVFERDDIARDVRILKVERSRLFWTTPSRDGWRLTLSGLPLLPDSVMAKRRARTRRRPPA